MIEFRDIGKSFFGVPVLQHVSFALQPGQTLGLVGENGAGKSTLMNILGGTLHADAGTMLLNGVPYAPRSPRDAEKAGIAFIHQELNLFANLTVAENLFIGGFPRIRPWLPWLDRRQMHAKTHRALREVDLDIDPDTPLDRLSAGERQLVEIAKALARDARLILFDEPTTSLTIRETQRLFAHVRRLHQRGISLIYISHSLGHVLDLCDPIVVLRDGAVAKQAPTADWTLDRLVTAMVGRQITELFPRRTGQPSKQVALELRQVSQPSVVRKISFTLRHGEIVGLAGLMGSGRSELARIIFGLDPCASGEILLDGNPIHGLPPRERIRRGLAFLTEDRRLEGLCLEASLFDNTALVTWPRFRRNRLGWVNHDQARTAVNRIRDAVRLNRSAQDQHPVQSLSGGNQQKVVLGKWLLNEPRVFLLDEPTRGIDVGAKHEIYRLIHQLADRGSAVLMISSELEELIGLCDRILVLNKGAIRDTVEPQDFDRERILRAALHDGDLA